MRRLTAVVVAILFLAVIGLVAWGVVDGRTAAKPWMACSGEDKSIAGPKRIEACDQVIKSGRLGAVTLPQVYSKRAALYFGTKNYPAAIGDYDRALGYEPKNPQSLNQSCWARAVAGIELDKALELCSLALSQDSADDTVNNVVIESAPETDPEVPVILNPAILDSRGLVNLKRGAFAAALADYEAALKADANSAHYLYGRGIAELKLGDIEAGRADLAAAIKKEPKIASIYAGYGMPVEAAASPAVF
ncbi:hypothetical protein BH11PSE2_BH11PSE2_06810 [soil metagenome]